MDKKVSAFIVGNLVGLTILVGGVLLTLPKKLKETEIIEKQELARKEQTTKQAVAAEPAPIESGQDAANQPKSVKELTPYVVATKNINRGETIVAAEVTIEKLPHEQNPDAISDVKNVVGKTTIAEIKKGSPVTTKVLKQ